MDLIQAFGFDFVQDGELVAYLTEFERNNSAAEDIQISLFEIKAEDTKKSMKKRNVIASGQLAFELF